MRQRLGGGAQSWGVGVGVDKWPCRQADSVIPAASAVTSIHSCK